MLENSNILLSSENMAPIEQAHLLRGFSSKKTPIKWIRFFKLCVLQREEALKARKKKTAIMWGILLGIFILITILAPKIFILALLILLILGGILNYIYRRNFNKKYADGYDFFASYFTALFTLIEEEMPETGVISLRANVKKTMSSEFFKSSNDANFKTQGFISGVEKFYEREICNGTCQLKDGAEANFSFIEVLRNRVINKRGISGKRKVKNKYKTTYPFILKMKIPKSLYILKSDVNSYDLKIEEDDNFYYLRVKRKFDIREEKPEDYSPYMYNSIHLFSVDYFTLEVMNLLNTCYGCFILRNTI